MAPPILRCVEDPSTYQAFKFGDGLVWRSWLIPAQGRYVNFAGEFINGTRHDVDWKEVLSAGSNVGAIYGIIGLREAWASLWADVQAQQLATAVRPHSWPSGWTCCLQVPFRQATYGTSPAC